ncbi:unnamed protein product [Ceutorhynchus assimilis]|uniref:Cation-dependent mannose-6-phosphate receptor n=1 Tax=Ceutorhynchus assimilis TaxID=467358 RepID=A0A9N9MZU1_9CUCU|nr:unnamed protein product [Ceutorhynchus assimilis]
MAKILYYVLTLVFLLSALKSARADQCIHQDPCSCTVDEYTVISLRELVPDKTLFEDRKGNYSYFFSGCEDKTFKGDNFLMPNVSDITASLIKCTANVTIQNITQIINATSTNKTVTVISYSCDGIGHAKDIKFNLGPTSSDYNIVYNNKTSKNSLPSIRLACDNFNATNLKILNDNTDELVLYSPLVCLQHIAHHEYSSGTIFCIIFFVTAIIYFFGGGLLMYFVRGARGIEVIPNFDFWMSLPGLMKDGLIYVLSGCRPSSTSTAETYDRI